MTNIECVCASDANARCEIAVRFVSILFPDHFSFRFLCCRTFFILRSFSFVFFSSSAGRHRLFCVIIVGWCWMSPPPNRYRIKTMRSKRSARDEHFRFRCARMICYTSLSICLFPVCCHCLFECLEWQVFSLASVCVSPRIQIQMLFWCHKCQHFGLSSVKYERNTAPNIEEKSEQLNCGL